MKHSHTSMALGIFLFIVLGFGAQFVRAQSQSPEIEALRQDLQAVQKELAETKKTLGEIRQLLTQRPPSPVQPANLMSRLDVGESPFLGNADAPITVIEFSDYQCPFCERFFSGTLSALKKEYIDSGKVRYVFRDFPLDSIHQNARKAAEAAHCAGEQGKYWEMHDALFTNQRTLMVENLKGFARNLGLESEDFNECLDQGRYAKTVSDHQAAGSAVGVTGTPSFFIGKTGEDGSIEAISIRGSQPIAAFRQVIDRLVDEN